VRHGLISKVASDFSMMHPIERRVSLPLHQVGVDVQLLRLEGDPEVRVDLLGLISGNEVKATSPLSD
jgi:hypothetical protein